MNSASLRLQVICCLSEGIIYHIGGGAYDLSHALFVFFDADL